MRTHVISVPKNTLSANGAYGLMKITVHSGSVSGTVVSRGHKICRQSDTIIRGSIKSPDRDFLLSLTLGLLSSHHGTDSLHGL